jgi:hypothetical protein
MAEWFEWEQGEIQKLGIKDFEFFDYLKAGLYPHSKHLKTLIRCPEEYHEYRQGCKFIESGNIYSDPCLFFNTLRKAKASGIESFLIRLETPLYDLCLNHGCYETKEGVDLKVSFSNIEELEELTRQDYTELQDEMGFDPADDLTLEVWGFFIVPEPEQECERIKKELTSKYIFSVQTANTVREKFKLQTYPRRGKKLPQEVIDLMEKASPEIEILYDAVKVDGFKSESGDPLGESQFKHKAMNQFKKKGTRFFKYVKSEYLADTTLYSFAPRQEPRDFKGKLLQKIMKEHGYGKSDYQEVYRYYSQMLRSGKPNSRTY